MKKTMIKIFVVITCFVLLLSIGYGQSYTADYRQANAITTDSLKRKLKLANHEDTVRLHILMRLVSRYRTVGSADSAIYYAQQAFTLATKINSPEGQINALGFLSFALASIGDLPKSLESALEALQIATDNHKEKEASAAVTSIGHTYLQLEDYPKAMFYYRLQKSIGGPGGVFAKTHIGSVYLKMNNLDSASYYLNQSLNDFQKRHVENWHVYSLLGDLETNRGNKELALGHYRMSLLVSLRQNLSASIARSHIRLANFYKAIEQPDSSIFYARKGLVESESLSLKQGQLEAAVLLAALYEPIDAKEALYYFKMAAGIKESLLGAGNIKTLRNMISENEVRQQKIEATKVEYQNRIRTNTLLGSTVTLAFIITFLFRNNRVKQRAKAKIEGAFNQLQSTQSQLIQSEKMASLGELTAGIAHEIQNPLNFVNNFSEVNEELLSEMKDELDKGNIEDAKAIATDAIENQQKILHHGKRADAIVKGMLQHSRSSSAQKELTDINALCDEYVRLSYHGLRAKDKSFNSKFELQLDPTLPKVNVVSQDTGRVVLNLINNAFYAVSERLRQVQPDSSYEPTVTVSTKNLGDKIEIRVKDNGPGIPESIKEKIFQPFFTTKPTGQGTGLGLSLSYDIVKAHGGELKVETKDGVGSEFIIVFPLT